LKKPDYIEIDSYSYDLPDHRIASYPEEKRDQSKLLIYRSGKIEQSVFHRSPEFLQPGDLLCFNTTRVIQARLEFRKESGARIEIFILEPHSPSDYQLAFSSQAPVEFICLIGNAKKWKDGPLFKDIQGNRIMAEKMDRLDDKFLVRFSWDSEITSFGALLDMVGSTPIPPYLHRAAEKNDAVTYQTVYAKQDGSVAAPTAGLHFTDSVLQAISDKGVKMSELVLHVGAGTFIPVKSENAVEHSMHEEHVIVHRELIVELINAKRIIAVGTTSTRSLESLYWIAAKCKNDRDFSFSNLKIEQWDPYYTGEIELKTGLEHLLNCMDRAGIPSFSFVTQIMITPGYSFKVINGLFTNFHQPKSTLLLLIAALVGDDWKRIYDYALANDFRFLSYGDSSLIFRPE